MQTCDIDHVVDALKAANRHGRKATLLLGAGCSVSAGIPSASGFVELIKRRHPAVYKQAAEKSYPACMDALGQSRARALVSEFVDRAKLNAAHIAVAELIRAGLVHRVLTTNFDPLVSRACALSNLFPAVYDMKLSGGIRKDDLGRIPDPSVFHLHGQHTAFALLHSAEETQKHKKRIKHLIQDGATDRLWIVVGYSGQNDPVLDLLGEVRAFDANLYWVGYLAEPPAAVVCDRLLTERKRGFHVHGYDADRFFGALATKLGCFPPCFFQSHLHTCKRHCPHTT